MNQELSNSLNMDAALSDIQLLIEQSHQRVTSYVNSSLTLLYWHIGLRIQHELLIKGRATYGNQILATLSQELTLRYGKGFNESSLNRMVKFASLFPDQEKVATLSQQLHRAIAAAKARLEDKPDV